MVFIKKIQILEKKSFILLYYISLCNVITAP